MIDICGHICIHGMTAQVFAVRVSLQTYATCTDRAHFANNLLKVVFELCYQAMLEDLGKIKYVLILVNESSKFKYVYSEFCQCLQAKSESNGQKSNASSNSHNCSKSKYPLVP